MIDRNHKHTGLIGAGIMVLSAAGILPLVLDWLSVPDMSLDVPVVTVTSPPLSI